MCYNADALARRYIAFKQFTAICATELERVAAIVGHRHAYSNPIVIQVRKDTEISDHLHQNDVILTRLTGLESGGIVVPQIMYSS